ncbi:undecaprenyl-diphosphate phosphatase [Sphingobacterium psychroaquaticum]|uniref:Undecaprenyl-diphosphatase n=1 Tax=Sphingobacterium psychroaquaticum TaxID=561061 RepID=A0A1X7JS99_9SPHI|nr:undecaprenyl-diphosphate phosphatase [Sphingobacterium psychroaquaticum]QBQ41028.1 undecaprenyl-diphosphate phosphatase [Sphingobacterium psychroaquaticum]SMG30941.1 undecaprenyl-diphosphatase [Sphingobacterium psychroaquaticum]
MTYFQAIVLAIIEGLTEFLPVSSTGHMIIGTALMGMEPSPFVKLFTIVIQLGTILSVLVLYFKRFFKSMDFYYKLVVAAIPASILGLILNDFIDSLLESPLMVAVMLVVGGIILLFVDKWFNKPTIENSDHISYKQSFIIGLYQCLALIPGTSRSASTIVGGMTQNLTRKAAAEFSFFLAIPMMLGASVVKLYKFFKEGHTFTGEEINLLIVGNIVGFIVAIVAIKTFIDVLTKYGFKAFGWYRIVVGLVIIGLLLSGHSLQII